MINARRPDFMTPAMWFVWLLRADICAGAPLDDAAAQREFVAWWLLFGNDEYPAAWTYGPPQVAVAMEPIQIAEGLVLPRYLRRLHQARDDLRRHFKLASAENISAYLCWYRMFAPLELAAAPPLGAGEVAATEVDSDGLPRMAVYLARWVPALRHGVQSPGRFAKWYREYGAGLLPTHQDPATAILPSVQPPGTDGVNLIGFARAETGLGEDLRGFARALHAAHIPHVVIDVRAGPQIRPRYGVSIFCLPAFDMAALLLAKGEGFFAGSYRIGWWPWELAEFPACWRDVYDLVDEIWVPSHFAAEAHRTSGKPVFVMAPAVAIASAVLASRRGHRSEDSMPYRFIYPFDIASHLARKNPLAAIRAFRGAFAAEDQAVSLVLRINGDPHADPTWPAVAAEADADKRILILPGTLPRNDALAIVAACDCLISPHRAEGFGRNIAEALLLGLEVIATGYSGCMDYLQPDECVTWSPVAVAPGAYPFAAGMLWAEPDIDDLVARMRAVRAHPKSPAARQARAAAVRESHAPAAVGRMVAARLRTLAGRPLSIDPCVGATTAKACRRKRGR